MVPLRDWTKIQGMIEECNVLFSIPLFPKWSELPQCSKYFLLGMKHIAHSAQDPHGHQTWAATQPFQKSLTRSSSPLCWSFQKKHARPFPDTFGAVEVQLSRFLWSNNLNQVLSRAKYNTQIQIDYTLPNYPKSLAT
jgi:hypothetical protein